MLVQSRERIRTPFIRAARSAQVSADQTVAISRMEREFVDVDEKSHHHSDQYEDQEDNKRQPVRRFIKHLIMPFRQWNVMYRTQSFPVVNIEQTEDVGQIRSQSTLRQLVVNPFGQRRGRKRKRSDEDQGEDHRGEGEREFEKFPRQTGFLRLFILGLFCGSGAAASAK